MLNQIFPCAYYINLTRRSDRRSETEAELARVQLRADRFAAIEPTDRGGFGNPGKRGCHLSHLAVLEMALKRGASRVLVMEDDVKFSDDFCERAAAVLWDLAPRSWDMFYFQVTRRERIIERFSSGLVRISGTMCAHCYVVNGSALEEVVNCLRQNTRRAIDVVLMRRIHPLLKVYGVDPSLAYQRRSVSDVTHPGRVGGHHRVRPSRPQGRPSVSS